MDTLNQPQPAGGSKQPLPNATVILVLGICSIVLGCLFVGLVCGIIAVVLSGKPRKMYKENPAGYEGWGQVNAGYIMGIIGICLGGLYVIYYIFVGSLFFSLFSAAASNANSY